jgi:hypothetical protein
MKMLKKFLFLVIVVTLCIGLCSCGSSGSEAGNNSGQAPFASYPEKPEGATDALAEGRLYKAGKINVLALQGTYEQMGQQYGALLKQELNENYQGIAEGLKNIEGLTIEELQEIGDSVYEKYPQKYKDIINGLAGTSGLGLEKAKVLNMQEIYISTALVNWAKSQVSQCSGMAAWGPYTSGGPLVFGRNYDLGFYNAEYATMTVYNPIDGSIPTASFTFAGCIYITSGMNSQGVFLELNNGSTSDSGDYTATRPWAPIDLFAFLEGATDLEQLSYFFETTRPDLAYIVNAADTKSAYSFEWATSGVKRRTPDTDGLLVATNHFVNPSWGILPPDITGPDVDFSVQRRKNLLALGEANKGGFDPEVMMGVISTPLEEGGAFRAPNLTSYEIVAEPAELKIWVRVPEYQDWVEIDLSQYFSS